MTLVNALELDNLPLSPSKNFAHPSRSFGRDSLRHHIPYVTTADTSLLARARVSTRKSPILGKDDATEYAYNQHLGEVLCSESQAM